MSPPGVAHLFAEYTMMMYRVGILSDTQARRLLDEINRAVAAERRTVVEEVAVDPYKKHVRG